MFISDSRGFGVADAWGELIEEAEGVEVRVHDHAKDLLAVVPVREWFSGDDAFLPIG